MRKLYDCKLGQSISQVYTVDSLQDVLSCYTDTTVGMLWVCDTHTRHFIPEGVPVLELPSGELAKNWQSVETIVGMAMKLSLARDSRFIAVGGGVVCDVTAFAASIFMRGCSVSLVPTTLLAMVDASLGGKTAIDLLGAKNLVGTFHPADDIFISTDTLKTLSEAEFRNGLGEVLKHAVLADDDTLLRFLTDEKQSILERDAEKLDRMIMVSLDVKRSYIEKDPTEQKGIRDALNLGHTFAHALESIGKMSRWSHGEAVAWGVVKALQAGAAIGVTPKSFAKRYIDLFASYGFDIHLKVGETTAFLHALESDKKRRQSQIRFVLMEGQGKHRLQPLPGNVVLAMIG